MANGSEPAGGPAADAAEEAVVGAGALFFAAWGGTGFAACASTASADAVVVLDEAGGGLGSAGTRVARPVAASLAAGIGATWPTLGLAVVAGGAPPVADLLAAGASAIAPAVRAASV